MGVVLPPRPASYERQEMLRLPDKANNKTKRWIVSSGFTADLRAQAGAMGLTSESLVTKTYIVRSGVPVRGHNRPKRGIGRDSRAYVCRCAVTSATKI